MDRPRHAAQAGQAPARLRRLAGRARQCREQLAAIPDDSSPLETAMEALGIISGHADGCADELEEMTQDQAGADGDGSPPPDE